MLIHYSAGLVIDVAKLHLHLAFSSFAPIQFTRELLSVKLVLILLVYLLALFYVFFIYLDCNAFFMNSIVFYCFFFFFCSLLTLLRWNEEMCNTKTGISPVNHSIGEIFFFYLNSDNFMSNNAWFCPIVSFYPPSQNNIKCVSNSYAEC